MTNDLVRQEYNKIADNYLAGRHKFKNDKCLEKLTSLLFPSSLVLDIGCGAGIPIDSYLIARGHKVIGIDISEKQVELARKFVPKGKFEVKDMANLKIGEYLVDAVVAFYAIFHTPRQAHQDILKKIYSFLKKDGYILITMGSSEWEGEEDNFFGGMMYWSHFGPKINRELVKKAGFNIILDEIDTTGREKQQIILGQK